MLLGNLRLVVAVLTAVTVAALASEARPDSPTEETWHAYLELRLSAGARSAYLFKALGPLGRTFTENCLDTEVGVYVEMATCVQEGDALGKECLNASNALRQELNAQLREIGAASPTTNLSVDVECRLSRVAYEFTALPPLAEVARDLHAGALPATGVVVNRDTVLDGHFYNWILHPCDTRKKMKRNELCVPTVQKFTARGGKGPYLSKKERSDRLAHAAGAAEAARVQSVESSSRITGAFGLEFGKAVALPWEAAEINAMINLPPSPEVFNYERRGWVMFAPLSVPQAFADLTQTKFLALLTPAVVDGALVPINISFSGRLDGDCARFKAAIDEALASKYGRHSEPSTFTDAAKLIRTKCERGGWTFSISYIDPVGYELHNAQLKAEADEQKRGIRDAARRDL